MFVEVKKHYGRGKWANRQMKREIIRARLYQQGYNPDGRRPEIKKELQLHNRFEKAPVSLPQLKFINSPEDE